LEKLKSCAYAPQTRQRFQDWLAENKAGLDGVRKAHVEPPAQILGMMADDPSITTCKAYRDRTSYRTQRDVLLRYSHREVGVDEALGSSICP